MVDFNNARELIEYVREASQKFQYKITLQVFDKFHVEYNIGKWRGELVMRDITGSLPKCIQWLNSQSEVNRFNASFEIGDIYEIRGDFDPNWASAQINSSRRVDLEDINIEDFAPLLNHEKDELFQEIEETISTISDSHLKELLEKTFEDDEIKEDFLIAPSAVARHHDYEGGNLEHTVGMLKIFKNSIEFYDRDTSLKVDLILTGIILHDIGKIKKYILYNGVPKPNPDYSFLEHHELGDQIICEKINEIENFPLDLKNQIRHIIFSHHGRKEWGSKVQPSFDEAAVVHYLDMIDSRVKSRSVPDD